jgi:hypothetical protein
MKAREVPNIQSLALWLASGSGFEIEGEFEFDPALYRARPREQAKSRSPHGRTLAHGLTAKARRQDVTQCASIHIVCSSSERALVPLMTMSDWLREIKRRNWRAR